MGANDKVAATFHPYDTRGEAIHETGFSTPEAEATVIHVNSISDWLCDQFQVITEEGGNDIQGEYVDDVTLGGSLITVEFSNGQLFRVQVEEILPRHAEDGWG